jgi:hypothetical protein
VGKKEEALPDESPGSSSSIRKEITMLHVHRRQLRAQPGGSALCCLILLVSLLLPTLLLAPPVQARPSTSPASTPPRLGDPREVETFLDGVN